ncbi:MULTISPECIES: pyridoxal phosphate-dependent decarboxylase family protein [Actinomadura]|uniref:Pyridoxal phosphate-dependent decarboxylase family protein n=1 Tax=Actinomadura yumaensis TaxID=111807 RepID=A0ABW2CY27_9ACTN|nr:aspartate aminotransferase family protein [Actinomadura sp. J1-007]MWK36297.1 aminotransferase class V-fold PLP-dependent enzyme [Actinomadura sp. J1-007]
MQPETPLRPDSAPAPGGVPDPGGLPEVGRPPAELLAELARHRAGDLPVRGGRVTAYVYDTGRAEVHDLAARAYQELLEVNCLDPTAFPSIVALERQVVAAVAGRLGGGADTPGIFTAGGTESIMLAVKAARDARPVDGRARIVLPASAHPAFHKAAHYLGMEAVAVPVDPETFRADPAATRAALTPRTVLVVASAPSYPHGVIDPVEEIAALAAEAGVPCHVDACVGGWVLPWLREGGRDVPPFDLSVPGVTSLSCDLHKYGYAPKGASVVLFADEAARRRAYFASAGWPGYTVINATVQSSRSAGPLAAAWATLNALGARGYRDLAAEAMGAAERLAAGVADIPGLRVLGAPDAPLVAVASSDPGLDVFTVADEARTRGWFFQPQLSFQGIPANLHFTLTGVSRDRVEPLLAALAESAAAARRSGPPDVPEGLADALAGLDLDGLDDAGFAGLLGTVGVDLDGGAPEMAVVNAVLDVLPPETRERLLIRFLAVLYSPHR